MNPHFRLPGSLAEIDSRWLEGALSQRYPGVEVRSLTFGSSVRATGTKLRMMLDYNQAGHDHGLPATMWFKGGYEDHSDHVRTSHARESLFYSDIEPLGLVNAPRCYFAAVDPETGFGVQLIEDLLARNASFGDARKPITPTQAEQALDQLARLHAYRWNSPELEALGAVGGSLATDGIVLRIMRDGAWDRSMQAEAAERLPASLRTYDAAAAGMEQLWALDARSGHRCMVHGDAHPGNLFFDHDGRPGFLDWQRFMQCDWAHDVNYFLVGSMTVDDCAEHEERLVRGYLEALRAEGVAAPDWDGAWLSYRRHAMYGLVWNVVPPTMQPKEVCDAEAVRFNAAVERLDTLSALFDEG